MRILSQSSSVFGSFSTVPPFVVSILTASKMLSAIGSIMSRISSLTETIGFMSPQSCGAAAVEGDGVDPFDDEHDSASAAAAAAAAHMARRRSQRVVNIQAPWNQTLDARERIVYRCARPA